MDSIPGMLEGLIRFKTIAHAHASRAMGRAYREAWARAWPGTWDVRHMEEVRAASEPAERFGWRRRPIQRH